MNQQDKSVLRSDQENSLSSNNTRPIILGAITNDPRPIILSAINNGSITWNQFLALTISVERVLALDAVRPDNNAGNIASFFQLQQGNVVASAPNVHDAQQMDSHNTPSSI